jgi:glutamyl endopeptidase
MIQSASISGVDCVALREEDMAQDKHQKASSAGKSQEGRGGNEDGGGGSEADDPHKSVSSGGDQSGETTETGGEKEAVADDFQGEMEKGELERVAGFDPSNALAEGQPASMVTDEMTSLSDADELIPEFTSIETVCGRDDRVRVSPCTAMPWRWICQLFITMPNGAGFRGTGWFIGPRCVMTAGHCVYSKANGGWARRIEVIPGMDAANRPYGSAVGTRFWSVTGWTNGENQNFDYGCIILPTPLGNTVGWFGFANLNDASLRGMIANNSGYAGDKPIGTQWFNSGTVTSLTAQKLYYMIDTYGGQSGSPMWRFANNQRHAVGIHAYGGCPNSSTRINAQVFNNMMSWRNL